MTKSELDELAIQVIGRPLYDREFTDVARTCAALRLTSTDVTPMVIILAARLRGDVMEFVQSFHSMIFLRFVWSRYRLRLFLMVIAMIALLVVAVAYAFKAGQNDGLRQPIILGNKAVISIETDNGRGALRLYEAGSAGNLAKCALPGWTLEGDLCVPRVDPISNKSQGFKIQQ